MTAPWPVVAECFSSDIPTHTCPQCDGTHEHHWLTWFDAPTDDHGTTHPHAVGPGLPVRCTICGARKCDRPTCYLRRHHRDPHKDY